MAFSWWKWRNTRPESDDDYAKQIETLRQSVPVPGIWLFGKTGSGKSSVVRYLTGAQHATIGEGYRPETKASERFDFPTESESLLSFVDTRGIAEASYDPAEDIERLSGTTQLMIVTVRVNDHALESILQPLREIRQAEPDRPVLLALTCLHQAAGRVDLSSGLDRFAAWDGAGDPPAVIPAELQAQIDEKISQFAGLHDVVIPIDLTAVEDGFADPDFGGSRLKEAILERLPQAYRQALLAMDELRTEGESSRQEQARWQVLGSSALAGTAGAVPVPWVDIPVVLAIQGHLAVKIAQIYDQELTAARWAILSSAAGSRIALRLAIREALKFIPIVGMAAGAASSFAFTYALGMSWDWYFADLRKGNVPSPERLKTVFADELKRGHALWNTQ